MVLINMVLERSWQVLVCDCGFREPFNEERQLLKLSVLNCVEVRKGFSVLRT